jgi:hypothetical protein
LSSEDSVAIRQRRIYVPHKAYGAHFAGCGGVILLKDGVDLLMLPVQHAASGGYVLKIRNAAGDRVVDAGDLFRDHGREDSWGWQGASQWDENAAGLRIYEVFLM